MRRALIALIAALPAFAAAQSMTPAAGTIDRSPAVMNLAQCSGAAATPNRVPLISDASDLKLTWQVKLAANQTFTSTTGKFKVYASTEAFQAGNSAEPWSCNLNSANNPIVRAQIGETAGYDAPAQTMGTPKSIALQSIASALSSLSCSPASATTTINFCVEWQPNNDGTAKGWATGSISFDPIKPAPPTDIKLSAGDGKLHVTSCTEGANDDTFIARATAAGSADKWSSKEQSCNLLTIPGLTNDVQYEVTVYAMSTANNPSDASVPVQGTPSLTDDFWQHYGGRDSGGCATGTGAAGLLGALALLALTLVVRRRKS